MAQQEGPTLTMQDLAPDYQWMRMLNWSDADLSKVPVHEDAEAGGEMLNLSSFGGTSIGVGGGTSANVRSLPNLYVYKEDTPAELWQKLKEIADQGGPSGYNKMGGGGEDAKWPPSGSSS